MALYEYEVDGTNLETYFEYDAYNTPDEILSGGYVSYPVVVTTSLDGITRYDGWRECNIYIAMCRKSALDAYVTAVFGGWSDPTSVSVTLRARENAGGDFADFSGAVAHIPVQGTDFVLIDDETVSNLTLRFTIP